MELGLLQAADRAICTLQVRASKCLANGDAGAAIDILLGAGRLRRDPLTSAMLAFARFEHKRSCPGST
jgi:hypothetical protein